MERFWKAYMEHNVWFHVLSAIAVGLIVSSFVLPPLGVIHPSVLQAVGEVFAFGALGAVLQAIEKGKSATVRHGETEMTISAGCEECEEKEIQDGTGEEDKE